MKILKSLFVVLFFISLASPVNAIETMSITPFAIVCDPGYVSYTESSRIIAASIDGNNGYAENNTGVTQSISEVITRTVYASISGGTTVELNYVAGKIGYKVEVAAGISTTKSQTINVNVPPYTSATFSYGSAIVKTIGTLKYLNKNCTYSYKNITANYTYGSYYRWN
jgi:hypothetical protein